MPSSAPHVRRVEPAEYDQLGQLTLAIYQDIGFNDGPGHAEVLRDVARRDAEAEVLVATDAAGRLLGTVTYAPPGSPWADIATPQEAEVRMLGVEPAARGQGIGEALVRACIARARAAGLARLVLCTQPHMHAAQRLYARLGFDRTPSRDWSPEPHLQLMAYVLPLATHQEHP